MKFHESLAHGAAVAEVAAGDHEPVRHFPVELLERLERDCLLPFDTERVDGVQQVDSEFMADILHQAHGVVEIAGDLKRDSAVCQRLCKLPVGDLAFGNEDHGFHAADRRIGRHAGAGVAGGGARDRFGMEQFRRARATGHAAVLETAGGVFALMLEIKIAETRPCAGGTRRVKTRVAFLTRYDLVIRCIQNEFAVSPYSGRFDSALHAPSFFPERLELSAVDFGKVALHIQHAAAVAGISELSDIIGSGTSYTLKK